MSKNQDKALSSISMIEENTIKPEEKMSKLKNFSIPSKNDFSEGLLESESAEIALNFVTSMNLSPTSLMLAKDQLISSLRIENERMIKKATGNTYRILNNQIESKKDSKSEIYDILSVFSNKLKKMHPTEHDLTESWFHKILPFLSPVRKYFSMFEVLRMVIHNNVSVLEQAIQNCELDIAILMSDKINLSETDEMLAKALHFNKALELELPKHLTKEQLDFMNVDLMNVLTMNIRDIEELRVVNLQSQASIELISKTSLEAVDAAKRAINVSVNALIIAGLVEEAITGRKELTKAVNEFGEEANNFLMSNKTHQKENLKSLVKTSAEAKIDMSMLSNSIESSAKALDLEVKYQKESSAFIKTNMLDLKKVFENQKKPKSNPVSDDLLKI